MNPDWKIINAARHTTGFMKSTPSDGFNGAFSFLLNGLPVNVIASDGSDPLGPAIPWEHVSVTIHGSKLPPSWSVMCQIKEIFWGGDECVMQLHPPKASYVNNHPGCLHLWRPKHVPIPMPPEITVGIKEAGELRDREHAVKAYHDAMSRLVRYG